MKRKKGLEALVPAETYQEALDAQVVTTPQPNMVNTPEIDYTQSVAEKMSKDYSDGKISEMLAEDGVKKPQVDENVEIIDSTEEYEAPTEEMKQFEQEKSDAKKWEDIINGLYSKEDREADERRQKAAKWVTAAQMLGDSIAALGNSYFTAKGANAMKLGDGTAKVAAANDALNKEIREKREKAAKEAQAIREREIERKYRDAKDRQAQANWQKSYDLQVKNAEDANAFREQTRLDQLAKEATQNAQWDKSYELAKKKSEAELARVYKENKPYRFNAGDGFVEIPKEYVNEQTIGAIFRLLPEEDRAKAGKPRYGKDSMNETVIVGYDSPDLKEMLAVIGMNMDKEGVADAVKRLGGKKSNTNETGETFTL